VPALPAGKLEAVESEPHQKKISLEVPALQQDESGKPLDHRHATARAGRR
jgi:hypothetical protein